jgi:hypothetical protein
MWTEGQPLNQIRYVFLFGSMEWKWSFKSWDTPMCLHGICSKVLLRWLRFRLRFCQVHDFNRHAPKKEHSGGTNIDSKLLTEKNTGTVPILGHSDFLNLANASSELLGTLWIPLVVLMPGSYRNFGEIWGDHLPKLGFIPTSIVDDRARYFSIYTDWIPTLIYM